jgi:hypothetical protein
MLGVFAGMLTLLMSLVGCAAANSQSRPALCCYLCVFLTVWSIQIASSVGMVNYSLQLRVKDVTLPSSKMTDPIDVRIQNGAFTVYQRCCTGCPNLVCNNPQPDSWVNYTMPFCSGQKMSNCTLVAPCSLTIPDRCYQFFPNDTVLVPPYPIDSSICNSMSGLQFTSATTGQKTPLIGPTDQGGCGGGDPKQFLRNLDKYLSDGLTAVAALMILVVVLESCMVVPGLILFIGGGNRYTKQLQKKMEDVIGTDEGGVKVAKKANKKASKVVEVENDDDGEVDA